MNIIQQYYCTFIQIFYPESNLSDLFSLNISYLYILVLILPIFLDSSHFIFLVYIILLNLFLGHSYYKFYIG